MAKGRTENSIRNSSVAIIGQVISVVSSFVVRTVFIKYLGNSYLGINGLFSNILSLLSFAELGFGTAIVYAMYKPIAENDEKRISAFMNFYAKIYRGIGSFILVGGLMLIPFLDFFIGDSSQIPEGLPPISIIYVLYLLNSAFSYFFNYKRSIITASQNGYLDSINQLGFTLLRNVFQLGVIVVFRSFVLYLLVQIVCTFLGNFSISLKADKLYPYLKKNKNEKLDGDTIKGIMKNVLAMACHKLGSVIVSGTDNILITKYVGLVATGQYSNYVLLTSTVRTLYLQLLNPITASIGNLIATESVNVSYRMFKRILFANSYIAIFCSVCLLSLANPFIELFWGQDSVFSFPLVALIVFIFFVNCIRKTAEMYIDTTGLFWQIKWKSIIEGIINLVASIVLAGPMKLGITGIVLGTLISNVATNLWWEPYVVYHYYFKKPLYLYFVEYTKYILTFIAATIITLYIESGFANDIFSFILKCVISVAVPNILLFMFFIKSDEMQYFVRVLKSLVEKKWGKRRA